MLVTFSKYFELKGDIVFECLCAECFAPVAMMTGKQLQHRLVRQGRMLCPECAASACYRCNAVVEEERRHYVSDTLFICPVCDMEKGAEWLDDWKRGLYMSFLGPVGEDCLSITPYLKNVRQDNPKSGHSLGRQIEQNDRGEKPPNDTQEGRVR